MQKHKNPNRSNIWHAKIKIYKKCHKQKSIENIQNSKLQKYKNQICNNENTKKYIRQMKKKKT